MHTNVHKKINFLVILSLALPLFTGAEENQEFYMPPSIEITKTSQRVKQSWADVCKEEVLPVVGGLAATYGIDRLLKEKRYYAKDDSSDVWTVCDKSVSGAISRPVVGNDFAKIALKSARLGSFLYVVSKAAPYCTRYDEQTARRKLAAGGIALGGAYVVTHPTLFNTVVSGANRVSGFILSKAPNSWANSFKVNRCNDNRLDNVVQAAVGVVTLVGAFPIMEKYVVNPVCDSIDSVWYDRLGFKRPVKMDSEFNDFHKVN